jgi:hypothetical protein
VIVRRFGAWGAVIGLALLACAALVERMTRPASGGAARAPARVARTAAPAAPPAPVPVARAPLAPVAAPPPEAASFAAPTAPSAAPAATPAPPARESPGAAGVDFSFQLDPRLTGGLHMGRRWVSPRTYSRTGDRGGVVVEAKAKLAGRGAGGARVAWAASEPDMVDVSPREGDEVRLTVIRPGESTVTARAGGASGTLIIRAVEVRGGALRVDIAR